MPPTRLRDVLFRLRRYCQILRNPDEFVFEAAGGSDGVMMIMRAHVYELKATHIKDGPGPEEPHLEELVGLGCTAGV